jgi:nucleoside 2-deoxyribosyltransferase
MKVHLIASKTSLGKDIDILRAMISTIKSKGHTLARDWINDAYESNLKTGKTADDWSAIYNESLGTIAESDVIIADATYENFGVGYMLAMAIQQKKPVLMLRRSDAEENGFARGVVDDWVRHNEYTNENIEKIIADFIDENDISTKDMRFNFFIDRHIYNYLRWSALKTGKTKAEILRQLVQNEIDKKS